MKDNYVFDFITDSLNIEGYESTRLSHRNLQSSISESSIKRRRSVHNVFDSKVCNYNRHCSDIQLANKHVMEIPFPVRPKHVCYKKQSVFSFDIISNCNKSFLKENSELKDHLKILLKQIKILKGRKLAEDHSFNNEVLSKLASENNAIKAQLKEKEQRLVKFKNDYDTTLQENRKLKRLLIKRKEFGNNCFICEIKEKIEYINMRKTFGTNDMTTTTVSVNNEECINLATSLSIASSNLNANNSACCYVKKVGIASNKKKDCNVASTTTSITLHPIVEKKLILSKSYNCLYYLMPKGQIKTYDMNKNKFLLVDYTDTCNFNKSCLDYQNTISLNVSNGLFALAGKECNQLYYYDSISNSVIKLQQSLYSHTKGSMIEYMNYYSEQRLICLCGNNHIKVELYCLETGKWSELPEMDNSISSRIDTGYLLMNNNYLLALYGYDYINDKYIDSIDCLSLSNPLKWEQIPLENQSKQFSFNLLFRNHTVFNTKYESNSNSQLIYFLGGYNSKSPNHSLFGINIKTDFSTYSLVINNQHIEEDSTIYTFSSHLYDYTSQTANRKIFKYGFDDNGNIHMIDTEIMTHNILSNSEG